MPKGDPRHQYLLSIACPHCRQEGTVVWEENGGQDREQGAQRRLVSLSDGFHHEHGRNAAGDPLLVCNRCDEILPHDPRSGL